MMRRMKKPLSLLLATLLLGATVAAQAAVLQLSIQGADGRPAADTVVLWKRAGGFQAFGGSAPALITQKDIRFSPYVTVVPLRGTVRFVNQDRFDHHVRSMPSGPLGSVKPSQEFEFRLAAARGGNTPSAELVLEKPGPLALGCHLHGSMRGHIFVADTPHAAVTDDKGRATLDVPDGPGELVLWHPDQLVEQPVRALQAAGSLDVNQALNFTPRRRPPPRLQPRGDYDEN
jgi:plastocyanin